MKRVYLDVCCLNRLFDDQTQEQPVEMGRRGRKMTSRTLSQVREQGISALTESLGPVDTIRFLQQFDVGCGDYTATRQRILGNTTVEEVVEKIRQMRGGTGVA